MSSPAVTTIARQRSQTAFIGLGANLDSQWGSPQQTLVKAAARLQELACDGFRLSSFYRSSPQNCPPDSPDFVNAVAELTVAEDCAPQSLLQELHAIENACGRNRSAVLNAPRVLDLDLLAFAQVQLNSPELTLPHPRLHERVFVLVPMAELSPDMLLPGLSGTVQELLARLAPDPSLLKL